MALPNIPSGGRFCACPATTLKTAATRRLLLPPSFDERVPAREPQAAETSFVPDLTGPGVAHHARAVVAGEATAVPVIANKPRKIPAGRRSSRKSLVTFLRITVH